MKVGTVTGRVWATKRHAALPHGAFVRLTLDGSTSIVALDAFGVGVGEEVLVVMGAVAANYSAAPVDAVVVGIIDPSGEQ